MSSEPVGSRLEVGGSGFRVLGSEVEPKKKKQTLNTET
jgi:hypothetical protein